jgi:hypothetical protein
MKILLIKKAGNSFFFYFSPFKCLNRNDPLFVLKVDGNSDKKTFNNPKNSKLETPNSVQKPRMGLSDKKN